VEPLLAGGGAPWSLRSARLLAGGGLQIADAGHSRILVWRRWPGESATQPDVVLGQQDFTACEHHGGRHWPDAATFNRPYGLAAAGE
jgi:hypothetical protein